MRIRVFVHTCDARVPICLCAGCRVRGREDWVKENYYRSYMGLLFARANTRGVERRPGGEEEKKETMCKKVILQSVCCTRNY